jgi:transposase
VLIRTGDFFRCGEVVTHQSGSTSGVNRPGVSGDSISLESGSTSKRYPPEPRERAVRTIAEIAGDHESERTAMNEAARLLGIATAETVRKWVRQLEVDAGQRSGAMSDESAELERLRRENAELEVRSQLAPLVAGMSGTSAVARVVVP